MATRFWGYFGLALGLAGCAQPAAVMPAQSAQSPSDMQATQTASTSASNTPVVTCHAQRLDVLYRAYWRCPADHLLLTDSQAEQIRSRLAQQVPAAALKGDGAFAPPPVGTRLYTSTGGFYEIMAIEGMTTSLLNQTGHIHVQFAGLFIPWINSDFDRQKLESLWPLEVGKRVQIIQVRDKDVWRNEFHVAAREKVTILAGEFDAYRIESLSAGLGTGSNPFLLKRKIWYAPAVGYIVKIELEQQSGTPTAERPWELARAVRPLAAAR